MSISAIGGMPGITPPIGTNFVLPKKFKTKDQATGIVIPETTDKCIIFPFDRKRCKYARDTYQKQLVAQRCTSDSITKVIENIEVACDRFKWYRFYRALIFTAIFFGMTTLLGSIGVIMGGMFDENLNKVGDVYEKSGHSYVTIIGILIFSFDILAVYIVIIIIGCLSNDLSAVYLARHDEILSNHKREFEEFNMRWKIGTKRLWLELWLGEYTPPDENPSKRKSEVDHPHISRQEKLLELRRGSQDTEQRENKSQRGPRGSFRNSLMLHGARSQLSTPRGDQSPRSLLDLKTDHPQSHNFLPSLNILSTQNIDSPRHRERTANFFSKSRTFDD